MLKLGLVSLKAVLLTAATVTVCLLYPGHGATLPSRSALLPPAYIERGNQVEKAFRNYNASLATYYKSLFVAVSANAPEFLPVIQAPKIAKSGYGILPELFTNRPAESRLHEESVSYSWPWTERMIDAAKRRLVRSEQDLGEVLSLGGNLKKLSLEKLVVEYDRLRAKTENIDEHIRYNRFWQAAIAADRSAYDRATALHDHVLERRTIRDELHLLDSGAPVMLTPIRAIAGLFGLTGRLKTREALLTRRIDDALDQVENPPVTLEHHIHEWIVRVPVYTDIEDRAFVASVKQAIETIWRVENGANLYRVEIVLSYVPPEVLYPSGEMPAPGESIDIHQHLRRFPAGAAVLTTGGLTTYVEDNAIVLGPHPITARVLAHEFGHLLGFRDRYIRGYKDLSADGFEVSEVIADAEDIMAVPSSGSVLLSHFELLLREKAAPTHASRGKNV